MNIEARLDEVRAEYTRRMHAGESRLLHEVTDYVTARNGKMLRPRMLLPAAATLGEEHLMAKRTLLLAVCVEMLHNTSLLHDDIIDRADSRRGRPSVNARWNNGVAVLVGDYLLTQTMQILDEVDDREATRRFNRTVQQMVEAELQQQPAPTGSQSAYLSIIDGKTASLFATAAAFGNPAYEAFGLHYGRLFQLRDDLADGELPPYGLQLIEQEERAIKQMDTVLNI